jgi:hypothetical protein
MTSTTSFVRTAAILGGVLTLASVATLSAHVIKGLAAPAAATAFVSSPSATADALIPIKWGTVASGQTGLSVGCFFVANSSPERADRPGWPRVTGAGFELPGQLSGFALLEPLNAEWDVVEGARVTLDGTEVTLDFAIVARQIPYWWPWRPQEPRGIPPGQVPQRGNGTRFCVSGPFPAEIVAGQPTQVEQVINGVVVGFQGVADVPWGRDYGIWDNAARVIPLYP